MLAFTVAMSLATGLLFGLAKRSSRCETNKDRSLDVQHFEVFEVYHRRMNMPIIRALVQVVEYNLE